MTARLPQLPAVLRIIQAEAGIEAVLRCIKALGGKQVYVGRRPPDNHPLVLAVGRAVADKVVASIHDERLDFPRANAFVRRLLAFELFRAQEGLNDVAHKIGLSRAQVKRYRQEFRAAIDRGEEPKPVLRPRARDQGQLDIEDFTT